MFKKETETELKYIACTLDFVRIIHYCTKKRGKRKDRKKERKKKRKKERKKERKIERKKE